MPLIRVIGNSILSFITKSSSGYWGIFDPTNGYTAISSNALKKLQFEKIDKRYFFETDMLFRLNLIRAVVKDIPMEAVYGDENSSLNVLNSIPIFLYKNLLNSFKRIIYFYFLREMSVASLEFLLGIILFFFGLIYGFYNWNISNELGVQTSVGTVMLSFGSLMMGLQFLMSFLHYDYNIVPKDPISKNIN